VSEPTAPGPDNVPDHVLDELYNAFTEESAPQYNFDDPSIDRLLGITDEHAAPDARDSGDGVDDDAADDDEADEITDDDELEVALIEPDDNDLDLDNDNDHDHDHDLDGPAVVVLSAAGVPPASDNRSATKVSKKDAKREAKDAKKDAKKGTPKPEVAATGVATTGVVTTETGTKRRVIVIAEDDRPDSVYLDEDKEKAFHQRRDAADESGERSTIVIADLDEAGASEPPLARSRGAGIDPRIRARRISVRRAEGRRRLIWAGIGIGVVLVAIGAIAVFASSVFDVREVDVQGAVYTDRDVLDSVIADLRGEPVLLVDTKAAERQLEAVPWVESARVSTDFPHRVLIDIRERRPIATFQGGDGQFRIIDSQGRVLDVIAGQPADYLLITGDHPDTGRGQFAGTPYAAVAELVVSLPPEIADLTSTVGVDPATGTLTMVLESEGSPDGVLVRLGDSQNLDEKLARLLKQVRSGLDGVCQLDVSTSDAGVVPC
jgi:cell division protein FtsQ